MVLDIKWHRIQMPDHAPYYSGYLGPVKVATIACTGRPGVDDYPWDWSIEDGHGRGSGVTDTYRGAKKYVEEALLQAIRTATD